MAFVREAFTTCIRNSDITDAHLNSEYAAQIAGNGLIIGYEVEGGQTYIVVDLDAN